MMTIRNVPEPSVIMQFQAVPKSALLLGSVGTELRHKVMERPRKRRFRN